MGEIPSFKIIKNKKYQYRLLRQYAESQYEDSENTEGQSDFYDFLKGSLDNPIQAMEPDSVILDNMKIGRIIGVDTVDNQIVVTGDFYRKQDGTTYEPKYFNL
jgi:hypothetical protein